MNCLCRVGGTPEKAAHPSALQETTHSQFRTQCRRLPPRGIAERLADRRFELVRWLRRRGSCLQLPARYQRHGRVRVPRWRAVRIFLHQPLDLRSPENEPSPDAIQAVDSTRCLHSTTIAERSSDSRICSASSPRLIFRDAVSGKSRSHRR